MSLDLTVTRLDLERFRAVQGSGDRRTLERILNARRQELADHDAMAGPGGRPATPPIGTLVTQIVDGRIDTTGVDVFRYEHAAAQIADALGTPLDADVLAETNPDLWSEVDRLIESARRALPIAPTRWLTLRELLSRGPVLDVPLDESQRLGSGFVTGLEARTLADAFEQTPFEPGPLLDELEWPDDALDVVDAYRGWIASAAAAGEGLFVHG